MYIREPQCKKCGRPVRYQEQEYCYECQKKTHYYEQGRSIWLHKHPVNWSIYQFKYHNRRIYGEFYAQELVRIYGKMIQEWNIDVIIPIPLHKKRRRKRGFNQTEIIAQKVGELLQIPVDAQALIRVQNTRAQKELNHKERGKNVSGAFSVNADWIPKKHVLLIDDIYTTGSTLDEAAKVLHRQFDLKVWFLTISIGQDF